MTTNKEAQRIYDLWHDYARNGCVEELLSLYAPDGVFESPLVTVLMHRESGICHGHDEMREFFQVGVERRPNEFVRWYRNGRYHFDGATLIWEYPGQAPGFEQLDLVEVMELRDGVIAHHKVYWGFRGVDQLVRSQENKRTHT